MFSSYEEDLMAKVTVTTFIEEEVKEGLKALADYERRSMSQMVAVIIERAIEDAKKQGFISVTSPSQESGGSTPGK